MRKALILYLLCAFSVISDSTFGQSNIQNHIQDTILIHAVHIAAERMEKTSIHSVIKLDSSILDVYSVNSLDVLLTQQSCVTINSYGVGGLSNSSIRGAGTSHTAVLWNGFNLQNLSDGGFDMTLVPVEFMDEISIQFGGASALFGSGAIGGVIHLENTPVFSRGIKAGLSAGYGSYSNSREGAAIEISKERLLFAVKAYNQYSKNNFPFINDAQFGKPVMELENAATTYNGVLSQAAVKLNAYNQISTCFWYQKKEHQIPPRMDAFTNTSFQSDEFYRSTLEWKRTGRFGSQQSRTAIFDNTIYYEDTSPFIPIFSTIRSKSVINEVEMNRTLFKFNDIRIGINHTLDAVITNNYAENKEMSRGALFGSWAVRNSSGKIDLLVNLRQEIVDNKSVPFTWTIGGRFKPTDSFVIRGNVSKNYKIPTLNDLYWSGLGDPDLKPESGISEEIGASFSGKRDSLFLTMNVTGYNSLIDNWIIWLPDGALYHPKNVKKVWSRGLEFSTNFGIRKRRFSGGIDVRYSYTRSTNMESEATSPESLNKQIIYVPLHRGGCTVQMSFKGYSFALGHSYFGLKYVSEDNMQSMDPYVLGDFTLTKAFQIFSVQLNIRGTVNNIWNREYQVMEMYPMPGRNYQIGLSVFFNQPPKTVK